MKCNQFHQIILKNGWKILRQKGSHVIYEKDGHLSPPVPDHGSKEMSKGLMYKLVKIMELNINF